MEFVDELVGRAIAILPQLSHDVAKELLEDFDYKLEPMLEACFENQLLADRIKPSSSLDPHSDVDIAPSLSALMARVDNARPGSASSCGSNDRVDDDYVVADVVNCSSFSSPSSSLQNDSLVTVKKEKRVEQQSRTSDLYEPISDDDDFLPDLITVEDDDEDEAFAIIDNKRYAVSPLSPVAAKRARLDSDVASSSDEIITLSSDDDEIQLLSSSSGLLSQSACVSNVQNSIVHLTETPTPKGVASSTNVDSSASKSKIVLNVSRMRQALKGAAELQASRQNARAAEVNHSSTLARNPRELYSNARVVGFRASNFTFRNSVDTGDKHYLVDCLEDWLMNALRRPAGVNDDIVSQFLSTLGTEVSAISSQAFTQLVNWVSQSSNQCAIMVQFAEAAAPRRRETTLPIARNELLTLLDKLLSEPSDGLLCKLDLVMTLIESDLTSRSPLSEQQLVGAMVNRLFPDKTSFWITDLVKCVVKASELTEGSTCSPYHSRVCRHISHLLSLITAASRDPAKIASDFAWKMLPEWKALPRAACRSRVLRLLADAPLLLLRVTQRIVDGLCPHPRLNWIGGVYFASLASIVGTYFKALPPHMDPHSNAPCAPESPLCSPPSSPDSLLSSHNGLNGNCDDGSEGDVNKLTRLYTAEAVEEFASLLYLLVESYITVAVGRLDQSLLERAWQYWKNVKFTLSDEDRMTLTQLPAKVSALRVHLATLCSPISPVTEVMLQRLICLSSVS